MEKVLGLASGVQLGQGDEPEAVLPSPEGPEAEVVAGEGGGLDLPEQAEL